MKYTAHVTGRDGRWWAVWIPALGGDARTQARRLADVENEARDYISVTRDLAPSTVEVDVVVDDFAGVREIQARSAWILAARQQIEKLETEVQEATKVLAVELAGVDVPMRDIAGLVGTTFQRVGQLVGEHASYAIDSIRDAAVRRILAIEGQHRLTALTGLYLVFPRGTADLPVLGVEEELEQQIVRHLRRRSDIASTRAMLERITAELDREADLGISGGGEPVPEREKSVTWVQPKWAKASNRPTPVDVVRLVADVLDSARAGSGSQRQVKVIRWDRDYTFDDWFRDLADLRRKVNVDDRAETDHIIDGLEELLRRVAESHAGERSRAQ